MSETTLTSRQRQILEVIDQSMRDKGYPPSVREIGEIVGLTSPSTVHTHLNTLQRLGYLRRDPAKPRAIEVRYDPTTEAIVDRTPVRHVPLLGDVAAGTGVLAQQNVEEVMSLPADLVGEGELFVLRVRGALVVTRVQNTAENGDIVIAGIPGDEATVKHYSTSRGKIVLKPANSRLSPMTFDPDEVHLYGRVVSVLRKL
jgi:repressor LexA